MSQISVKTRKAKSTDLQPYCHFSDEHSFMEVTEWANGEGVDVTISSKAVNINFALTFGEWECLQVLMNYREK